VDAPASIYGVIPDRVGEIRLTPGWPNRSFTSARQAVTQHHAAPDQAFGSRTPCQQTHAPQAAMIHMTSQEGTVVQHESLNAPRATSHYDYSITCCRKSTPAQTIIL